VLAAIAGARPGDRNQAGFAVNLDRGGTAGQITVVPKRAATTESTQDLGQSLDRAAAAFARRTHTEVAVGGPAGQLADFQSESAARILPVIVGVAAVVTLLLMVLLRSVVLPAVAVAFDLLTTGATFGLLWLLFGGDEPLLGGPGYIDPVSIICIFAAVFGITVVYEVALLQRTREALDAGRDAVAAVREGLRWTHLALTGAALVMVCAFVPLAASDLITIRQLGAGLTIAVLLDALIVRPVLLPAAMAVLGRRAWWPARRRTPVQARPPAAA
jgi:RND superfamily putative drug exporter